ncbi:MAG: HyaD/HybD family hydrogenase maturation endopeptidase [Bryobacteraceae bacterium]
MTFTSSFDSDIVAVGIGNVVHTDDGAGVHALQMLRDSARVPAGVSLIEGGTLGLELVSYLQNAKRILLLDAVDANSEPGSLLRLTREDLLSIKGGLSVHQLGVADLLAALSLVSHGYQDVLLLGVQPQSTDWGTELTPKVKRALPALVETALEHLHAWAPKPTLRRIAAHA